MCYALGLRFSIWVVLALHSLIPSLISLFVQRDYSCTYSLFCLLFSFLLWRLLFYLRVKMPGIVYIDVVVTLFHIWMISFKLLKFRFFETILYLFFYDAILGGS